MAGYAQSDAVEVPTPTLQAAPDAVQQWLRQEDWEALTKAWAEAEAQAIAWAEGSNGEEARMQELWHEASQMSSLQPNLSMSSLPPLSQTSSRKGKRRPKWDQTFNLLGSDSRKPGPLRRYFDSVPGESTIPKHLRGDGDARKLIQQRGGGFNAPAHLASRRPWVEAHSQTVSPDNEALHPHLRSYFDRRGLESCYRERPIVDQTSPKLRPRTPGRPSTREKIMRFRSTSEPSLASGSVMSTQSGDQEEKIGVEHRHYGNINWGRRCLHYNTDDYKLKPTQVNGVTERIPWVGDHHVMFTADNEMLHPGLRHYFDVEGLEASFRNRGMHYGRKPKPIPGTEEEPPPPAAKKKAKRKQSQDSSSDWDSIHSSLLDKLSYSSLLDSDTPGGLPVVRGAQTGGAASIGSQSIGGSARPDFQEGVTAQY